MEEVQWPDTPFILSPCLELVGRRGSEAHGTFIPSNDPNGIDDRDLMGIVIPPDEYYLGLEKWESVESIKGQWDVVLYDFKKFVGLLAKQNPNVLGMLWLEKEDYLHLGPAGNRLIYERNVFRSRRAAHDSFVGYARAQMNKMIRGAFLGYMGEKRKALVSKYGYDCKNAAHLIRLLHMGREYLETGILNVRRTWDREMLIEIKRGEWSLEFVQSEAEACFRMMDRSEFNSPLPEEVNMFEVKQLAFEIIRDRMKERGDR